MTEESTLVKCKVTADEEAGNIVSRALADLFSNGALKDKPIKKLVINVNVQVNHNSARVSGGGAKVVYGNDSTKR